MMDWSQALSNILTSPNALMILGTVLIILIIFIRGIKEGYLHFNKAGINVGNAEKERNVIRQQIEYTHTYLTSLEAELEIGKDINKWRVKYVIERVYDEVVDWISFNHITDKGDYVSIKQDRTGYGILYSHWYTSLSFKQNSLGHTVMK